MKDLKALTSWMAKILRVHTPLLLQLHPSWSMSMLELDSVETPVRE